MKPARYIVREDQHTKLHELAYSQKTTASALVRLAVDRLLMTEEQLPGFIEKHLAHREDGS